MDHCTSLTLALQSSRRSSRDACRQPSATGLPELTTTIGMVSEPLKRVARAIVEGDENRRLGSHHFFRQGGNASDVRRDAQLEAKRLPLDLPERAQLITEGVENWLFRSDRNGKEGNAWQASGLRRGRHDRRRENEREEDKRDHAPSHSITSSARASSEGGM